MISYIGVCDLATLVFLKTSQVDSFIFSSEIKFGKILCLSRFHAHFLGVLTRLNRRTELQSEK